MLYAATKASSTGTVDGYDSYQARLCCCSELTDGDIRTAIKNSGGVRGSLLIPEAPFELLVRRAIGRLLTPSLQCKEARAHH